MIVETHQQLGVYVYVFQWLNNDTRFPSITAELLYDLESIVSTKDSLQTSPRITACVVLIVAYEEHALVEVAIIPPQLEMDSMDHVHLLKPFESISYCRLLPSQKNLKSEKMHCWRMRYLIIFHWYVKCTLFWVRECRTRIWKLDPQRFAATGWTRQIKRASNADKKTNSTKCKFQNQTDLFMRDYGTKTNANVNGRQILWNRN